MTEFEGPASAVGNVPNPQPTAANIGPFINLNQLDIDASLVNDDADGYVMVVVRIQPLTNLNIAISRNKIT